MDLFQRVKHLVGKGVQLDVELPQKYLAPGSTLSYRITLASLEPVTVRVLTVEAGHSEAPPGTVGWGGGEAQHKAEPIYDLALSPEHPTHLAGLIPLPSDAPATVNDPVGACYWSLRVKADVPGGIDPAVNMGFVVGPTHHFEWSTPAGFQLRLPGQAYTIQAQGTCTIVRLQDTNLEEVHTFLSEEIPGALLELLTEQHRLLDELSGEPAPNLEIAGALREILTPRVRELPTLPFDSLAGLTVDAISAKRA